MNAGLNEVQEKIFSYQVKYDRQALNRKVTKA